MQSHIVIFLFFKKKKAFVRTFSTFFAACQQKNKNSVCVFLICMLRHFRRLPIPLPLYHSQRRPLPRFSMSGSPASSPVISDVAMSAGTSAPTPVPKAEAPAMKRSKKVKKLTKKDIDEVLMHDIVELRGHSHWDWDPKTPPPFQNFEELEVTIGSLAQSGEGLALLPDRGEGWVLVVPFVVPGEKVKARVYRHNWYVVTVILYPSKLMIWP